MLSTQMGPLSGENINHIDFPIYNLLIQNKV